MYAFQVEKHLAQDRAVLKDQLTLVSAALSQALTVRLTQTHSLVAFVKIKREFTQRDFDRFTSSLEANLTGLLSLQLAPKGIVTYVTNLEKNRAALGHDLFGDPKRRILAEKSVKERKYIIAGPINLIQGGRAIIARTPIFLPRKDGQGDAFWGFATILIDVDAVLREAGFLEFRDDLSFAIRGKDALGAKGEVFVGEPATFENALAVADVILPTGSWQIAAAFNQLHSHTKNIGFGWFLWVGGLLGLLGSVAVYCPSSYKLEQLPS